MKKHIRFTATVKGCSSIFEIWKIRSIKLKKNSGAWKIRSEWKRESGRSSVSPG